MGTALAEKTIPQISPLAGEPIDNDDARRVHRMSVEETRRMKYRDGTCRASATRHQQREPGGSGAEDERTPPERILGFVENVEREASVRTPASKVHERAFTLPNPCPVTHKEARLVQRSGPKDRNCPPLRSYI